MKCADCRYANKSGKEDWVYCTYWTAEGAKSETKDAVEFVNKEIYKYPEPKEVAFGWGYPNKPFKGDSSSVVEGTIDEGLMWNNQICVSKDDKCHKIEVKGKHYR